MKDHEMKIRQAMTALVLDEPFFGVLALRLKIDEDPKAESMWTDGVNLGYNAKFVKSLKHEEIKGLLAHEVMHCASGHPWRRGAREQKNWNKACDRSINSVLTAAGFTLPSGSIGISKEDEGKSAEWIFDRMPKDPEGNNGGGKGDKGGSNPPGEVRDAPGESEEEETEEEWREAVQQAARAAQSQGKLPGALDRFAGKAAKPPVDWRSVLRRFVQDFARSDYSWSHPNTRFLSMGLYLPSLRSHEVGPIMVVVDTSGSIDQVTLDQFWAEVSSISAEVQPLRLHVVYADSSVAGHDIFERGDEAFLKPRGGGGTDFEPAFKLADSLEEQPVCIIYLTDLLGHFPPSCEIPTLWAATQEHPVPFGEVVPIA